MMRKVVVVLLAVGAFCGVRIDVAAQDAATEDAATETFLLSPPPGERPTVVRASFLLQNINEIDDAAETFEFRGVLRLTWHDPRRAFDPVAEGVDEKLYQGSFQFNELFPAWYPQVVLVNESGFFEKQGVILRVQPDGTTTLVETVNARAKAFLNLQRYPFDRQHLYAVFEVLGSDNTEVVLEAEATPPEPSDYEARVPEWTLESVSTLTKEREAPYAGEHGTTSAFVVSMDVERNSFFAVRLIVIPLMLIVMLSWSVFWMERSSLADRISVSFIGILTAVTYQLVVTGIQPDISYITLMHGFLNLSFVIMCATVVINLWVGHLDKQGRVDAGDRIDYRSRWVFPSIYFGLNLVMVAVTLTFF